MLESQLLQVKYEKEVKVRLRIPHKLMCLGKLKATASILCLSVKLDILICEVSLSH